MKWSRRGAALGGRRGRHGPDPRWQRHPQLRDAPALPRRRHGRILARAQDAQGPPGRAGGGARLERAAGADLRAPAARHQLAALAPGAGTAAPTRSTRPDEGRIAADRTNPSASSYMCCPNRPWAGPALHEPHGTARGAPKPNEPEKKKKKDRKITRQPVAALRLGPICRCSSRAASCSARSGRRPF